MIVAEAACAECGWRSDVHAGTDAVYNARYDYRRHWVLDHTPEPTVKVYELADDASTLP